MKDGKLVGTVGLRKSKKDEKVFILKRMMITPDQRGKGVAQVLMNKCFQFAKEKNARSIKLTVWSKNLVGKIFFFFKNFFIFFYFFYFFLFFFIFFYFFFNQKIIYFSSFFL